MSGKAQVLVLDDEGPVVRVTSAMLAAVPEFDVQSFTEAEELLRELEKSTVACIVSDLVMPHIDGLELQQRVLAIDPAISMVFLSGRAGIAEAVQLMKHGAISLLEKPYQPATLIETVKQAIERHHEWRATMAEFQEVESRITLLDPDERDVMRCTAAGMSNKAAVQELCISSRTLDRKRQRVFEVMGVSSAVQLAAMLERFHLHASLLSAPHLSSAKAKTVADAAGPKHAPRTS